MSNVSKKIVLVIGIFMIIGGIFLFGNTFMNFGQFPWGMGSSMMYSFGGGLLIVGGIAVVCIGGIAMLVFGDSNSNTRSSHIYSNNPYSAKPAKKSEEKKETLICEFCGQEITKNIKFCTSCGAEQK
ncbi:MAG: hypothetical protein KGD57_05920 [Candidatus Lokiarchaeota archaeon]|nr:hypothetical protein [Candidatus Lokiarchaeota archaeon]